MELEDDIKEGFICPICVEDLKSPTNLASHFDEFHSEDNLAQLRSVIGKATKKIFKKDQKSVRNGDVDSIEKVRIVKSHGTPETGGIDIALWEPQEFGKCVFFVFFSEKKLYHVLLQTEGIRVLECDCTWGVYAFRETVQTTDIFNV